MKRCTAASLPDPQTAALFVPLSAAVGADSRPCTVGGSFCGAIHDSLHSVSKLHLQGVALPVDSIQALCMPPRARQQ